jgi:hypothetical protein
MKVVTRMFAAVHSFSVKEDINFQPLDEIVHGNQEVSISPFAVYTGLCSVNGRPT